MVAHQLILQGHYPAGVIIHMIDIPEMKNKMETLANEKCNRIAKKV